MNTIASANANTMSSLMSRSAAFVSAVGSSSSFDSSSKKEKRWMMRSSSSRRLQNPTGRRIFIKRRASSSSKRNSTNETCFSIVASSSESSSDESEKLKQNLARRLGAAAIVSTIVFLGGQKSAANASIDTVNKNNDNTSFVCFSSEDGGDVNNQRVAGEVASSSSSSSSFQPIANLKPTRRGFKNEAVGTIAAADGSTTTEKEKKKKKKPPVKSDKGLWSFVKPKADERTRLFRARFDNDVRKMPTSVMTDEESAEARKWKKESDAKKRRVWKEEKEKFMKKYGSQAAWEAKLRKRNAELAGDNKRLKELSKKAADKAVLTLAQMDTYYGEIEESAKNLSKARKEVMQELLEERETWLEQRKGWFGKMLRSDASKRFVRTINYNYLKDPYSSMGTDRNPTETSYTGFYKLLEVGRINKIVFGRNETTAKYYVDGTDEVFFTYLPYDERIAKKILQPRPHSRGEFIELSHPGGHPFWWVLGHGIFNALCPLIIVAVCYQMLNEIYRADETEDQFANIHARQYSPEKSSMENRNTSLDDIAGIEALKDEMYELIKFLRDFQKYKDVGAAVPGGILLSGPPGTGKTLLARCIAGEAGVPFFSVAATEFTDMFVGIGASRVRNLFAAARKVAPCIIFIDEFDAVGQKRAGQSGTEEGVDERVATINQFLAEMDGFEEKVGVMLVAATNRPQVLDPALIRPGRFDRIIEMNLPNKSARSDIIRLHITKRDAWGNCEPDLDIDYISKLSSAFSGADLENMVKQCIAKAAGQKGGMATTEDFLKVINSIRATKSFSSGSKDGTDTLMTRSKFKEDVAMQIMNPYTRDSICLYTAAQVVVAMVAPEYDDVANVIVFPGGKETSVIQYIARELDSQAAMNVRRRTQMESKMCTLVAGNMAERYIYGPYGVSTMSHRDMVVATDIALDYVCKYGWSELGPVGLMRKRIKEEEFLGLGEDDHPEEHYRFEYNMSEELDMLVYNEVRKLIITSCRRALCIMHEPKNREMLFTLKEVLMTTGEISGRNLIEVFERAGIERTSQEDELFKPWSVWDYKWGEEFDFFYDEFIHRSMSDATNEAHYEKIRQLWLKNMRDETYLQTIGPHIREQMDKVDMRQMKYWKALDKNAPDYDPELVEKYKNGEIEWLSEDDPKHWRAQKRALNKLRAEQEGFADYPLVDMWEQGEINP